GNEQPNLFDPSTVVDHGKVARTVPGQAKYATHLPPYTPISRPTGVTMRPLLLPLSANTPVYALGSDQRLGVAVPKGAVTAQVIAQAQTQAQRERTQGLHKVITPHGAALALRVTQLEGPSGGAATDQVSFGTYLFTLIDEYGQPVNATLAQPVQLALHLPPSWVGADFDLSHVQFIVNGSVPVSALKGLKGTNGHTQSLGPLSVEPVSYSPAHPATAGKAAQGASLQTTIRLSGGGGNSSGTWNTNAPNAHWQTPADTSVDLAQGDLTYSYPLDIPSGPGGFTVPLALNYSSGNVASNHNPQSAAGWLGEGWDLSVGAISWSEHNVNSYCSASCQAVWEDSWQFSDPFGNGGDVIPQDSNISNWYDDTGQGLHAEPLTWNLDSDPYVKIVSYTNPTSNPNFPSGTYPTQPPCFRAFLPDGVMEEFGCTTDSLQYHVSNSKNFIDQWNLDMVVDANGNQIHFTYTSITNTDKTSHISFPIDTVLSTITYDSPTCHSTTSMCTGSNWQPQAQIVFFTAQTPTRLTGSACPTFTNTTTYGSNQTMRCDDVQDLKGSGGLAAPALQALLLLNAIEVQVSTSGSSPTWETLRKYDFSFEQSPSTGASGSNKFTDAATGQVESIAGYLDLTQMQEIGDDGSASLPPLTMSYQTQDESYVDTQYTAAPSGNCGFTWNTTNCLLWAEMQGRYLASLDNGEGWQETYTFMLARNNTHGVNTSGLTPPHTAQNDPFSCTYASSDAQKLSPCNKVDDENWSREVITQRQASVKCVMVNGSNCGNGGTNDDTLTSTWSYQYYLAQATALECGDCTMDMYWGNENDADKLDFYNATFMGFQIADVTNPDGSLLADIFYSTEGYGLATQYMIDHHDCGAAPPNICYVDPWASMPPNPYDATNALHGRLSQEKIYADSGQTTLLTERDLTYTVTCPPNGMSGSPSNTNQNYYYVGQRTSELDHQNPVIVCEIETATDLFYHVDGSSNITGSPSTLTTDTYTYDGSGHLSTVKEDVAASDASATPHVVTYTQYEWNDAITTSSTSATGPYLAQFPSIVETQDGSGNDKACVYTGYDGNSAGVVGSHSGLTQGLETSQARYATNCTPGQLSGAVWTERAYDLNGDLLATKDADAVAGISGHTTSSCAVSGTNYTACATYDNLYDTQLTSVTNDLTQVTWLGYQDTPSGGVTPDPTNGWGQWDTSIKDANNQKTFYGYDPLGRLITTAQPGDSYSSPTTSYSYPVTCSQTGAQTPCVALTTTQRLSGSVTYQSGTFYDGWGRPAETLKPEGVNGTTCTFAVTYTLYDASGRAVFTSNPYFAT
ncbi:MAG TPA: hypothetical protein VKQ36_13115, partial [Ktedonobacterales bacterium]|nr:hypothetical protein [Ktedonobacterales bacterium]